MQLNTTTALVTALLSAVIGFGLAFFIERKLSGGMQNKSQKILTSIAMISFGYGLMATLNELIGFPLQGLQIRYDKLVGFVFANILFLPIVLLVIAKLIGLNNKDAELETQSTPVVSNKQKQSILGDVGNYSSEKISANSEIIQNEVGSVTQLSVGSLEIKLSDEEINAFYESALDEIEKDNVDRGLWARSFAVTNGNETQAKAKYIELRVDGLSAASIERKRAVEVERNIESLILRSSNEDVNALLELGQIRFHGLYDQKVQLVAAFDCFKKAAHLGSAQAQYMLSSMFWKGEGTSKNNIFAHAWAVIASSDIVDAKKNVALFQERMTSEEIYKSDDLVSSLRRQIISRGIGDNFSSFNSESPAVKNNANMMLTKNNMALGNNAVKYWTAGFGLLLILVIGYGIHMHYSPQNSNLLSFKNKKLYDFYMHTIWSNCNSPYEDKPIMTMEFMFNDQSKEIIAKIDYEEKGIKKQDFTRLESCSVNDSENWRCGGNLMPNGKDFYAQYEMTGGKFIYSESSHAKCPAKIIAR